MPSASTSIQLSVIPTGGAVLLLLPGYLDPSVPTMTLSRAVSGVSGLGTFTQIYSGSPLPVWVDAGDMLPAPLSPTTQYVYQITDASGTSQAGPITPSGGILTKPDQLTELFIRLLQAGVSNLPLPQGINPVQVVTAMPQGGWQALPFIIVNLDLLQQAETQIGQDVTFPDTNNPNSWSISVYAKRLWRVTVFTKNTKERDFYRDSLLAIFQVLLPSVFVPLGLEIHHSFQAASGTDPKEYDGHIPGFYYADLLFEIDGSFEAAQVLNYGLIETITTTATFPDGTQQVAQVPLTR